MYVPAPEIASAARSITESLTKPQDPLGPPFAHVLRDAVVQVQGLETQATEAVNGLISGNGVDIHTALIATQKADTAFEMALSVRNKAVAAYQQLMSTQF